MSLPPRLYLIDKARRTFVAQFERRMQSVVLHPRAGIVRLGEAASICKSLIWSKSCAVKPKAGISES